MCGFIYRKWTYAIGNFYNVHHAAYNLPQSSTVEERFSEDDTTLRNLTLVPLNCSIIIIFCFFVYFFGLFFFSFLCAMRCFPIPCAQTAKELLRYQIIINSKFLLYSPWHHATNSAWRSPNLPNGRKGLDIRTEMYSKTDLVVLQ